jgi:hypothetical protein
VNNALEEKKEADPKPGALKVQNSATAGNKFSEERMASKQRKKRAHKRTLRRSNANG